MAFAMDDYDLKHLKKGKFGPLDVYPQEEKQKEVRHFSFTINLINVSIFI